MRCPLIKVNLCGGVRCGVLYSHIMQLYFVSFQSPVKYMQSLQSTRLIETSLTLYSRNQNCNNYFHHVKHKYIKQNISRYFYSTSYPVSSDPPTLLVDWLQIVVAEVAFINYVGGQASVFRATSVHLVMSCRVLSCQQLHPVTSFHMTSTTPPSQSVS